VFLSALRYPRISFSFSASSVAATIFSIVPPSGPHSLRTSMMPERIAFFSSVKVTTVPSARMAPVAS
jgi:hypothetical protein